MGNKNQDALELRERIYAILTRADMTRDQLAAATDAGRLRVDRAVRALLDQDRIALLFRTNQPGGPTVYTVAAADIAERRAVVNARNIAYASSVWAWGGRP